ncbi:MAG: hypothetical protein HKM07_07070 [Chlamydiae bacterium]|nr:hypothetical protein [Chlamydiota bacterium]
MAAEVGKTASISSFFNSALESVFAKETISSAKEVVTRFLSSSDYLMSVSGKQVPTFFALKEIVPHTAFIAVSAYAIGKLALTGVSNVYNSTSTIQTVKSDSDNPPKYSVHSYAKPSNYQIVGSIVKGFSQIALAGLAGVALYNHTENYRNIASAFLASAWKGKAA